MSNTLTRVIKLLAIAVAITALPLATASANILPTSPTLAPNLLYDGTAQLNAGQIPFPYQSYIRPHVTVVPDPLGGAFNVMKFAVSDSDRPYSGASNPRADFETSGYFTNGSDLYYSLKFMEPAGFPVMKGGNGFFQISEVYGPPHGGSPALGFDLFPGAGGRPVVSFERDAHYGYDRPWTSPTLDTGWHTLYVHTHSAPDNTGSVQVWFDGVLQKMSNGSTTINYPTLASGINWDGHTPNVLNVNQYRRAGAYPGTVVTYQAAAKIGTTLASVTGGITPPPPTLVAAFAAPTTSKIGQTVTFDATGSTGSPVSYAWTDGANSLGTGQTMAFTFHYAGTKHVTLKVTDANGATATVEHDLVVS